MKAGLSLILFVLVVSVTVVQSQIIKGPVNALKRVGDNVMLECVTSSRNCDQVEWMKVEGAQSGRAVYSRDIILNSFPGERYSVNSTGGCNLTITQLKVNDSGRFSCVLLVGDMEETRSSILVVISVREACRSNVTSNELNHNDSYSFRTAINVPAKSVEPSNVILSFQNKADDETETTDESQSPTVKTTLTGIARKQHVAQRACMASFFPNTAADFDNSTAFLDVCTTQQLIVSYPVERVTVWPNDGKFHEGNTINCTADGYPIPTFLGWNSTSGLVVQNGSSLNITEDSFGHNFTFIAKNTVNGNEASKEMIIVVPKPYNGSGTGCSSECIVVLVVSTAVVVPGVVVVLVAYKYKKKDPVESIAASPTGHYKGAMVRCRAEGYPFPSFKCLHLKSGDLVDGDTMVTDGEVGDEYTCTATNTVKGKATSLNTTIEVVSTPELCLCISPGGVAAIAVLAAITGIIIIVAVTFFCYHLSLWNACVKQLPFC